MSKLVLVLVMLMGGAARADERPCLEWSSWVRLGYRVAGSEAESGAPGVRAITTTPPAPDAQPDGEAALGIDLTLGLGEKGDVRVGAWAEATSMGLVGGGELLLGARPADLDLFWYKGEGVVIVRAGGNDEVWVGALSYGYRAPWDLWGPWRGASRYMIGVRLVASAMQSRANPDEWSATLGLEFEPVGALRYVLGIKSWY